MKIQDIRTYAVQAPGRTLVVVLVSTDEGITGVGEAGLQRRWQAIMGAVEHMRPWLIGQDPFRIEHLWQRMFRGGFYPGDRLIGSAIAGIDIALWDVKAQALGVPLYELLGGRCCDYVEVFSWPGFLERRGVLQEDELLSLVLDRGDPEATVKLAQLYLAHGYRFFRLGLLREGDMFDSRHAIGILLAQLGALRDELGDEIELMVDLHGRLNPPEALWFCREVEPLRMFAVEDPIRSENPASYRHIRQHLHVPLAAGEQWANKWEFRQAIEEELVDFVRVDVCIAGGLTEARKIAGWAETHYIQMLLHNPLGPVCTAACLHLDLACSNAGPQEVMHSPDVMLPDVFECTFEVQNGRMTLPTAPGLGVTFNVEAALAHPAEMTEPPHLHRPDGTYTNY
jgi:L-alanine-DL-glutamate epimerase-like enolase superfamily enzyme